jgi:cysteinyl-tRNA synthetase
MATLVSNLTVAEDAAAAPALPSVTAPTTAAPAATALPSVSAPTTAPPPLQLFNSKTKKKELFVPRVEGKVGMYVCGVTPYDFSHVGHARAYVAFDVLYR